MKTISELIDFYYNVLLHDLKELEKRREKIAGKLKRVIYIIIAVSVVIIFSIYILNENRIDDRLINISISLIAVAAGIYAYFYKRYTKNYNENFKEKIIKKLIHFIDPSLRYEKRAYVPKNYFLTSALFRQTPDRYGGNDFVNGKIGKTEIMFSDLHAEYKTTDSKGRTHYHTIFQGLFFVADFNKKLMGKTVVLPDTAQKLFGFAGTFLQSINRSKGELVKLDDPAFEKEFVVYSSDQIEARYILTHSLMKRVLDFKRKRKAPLYLSFVGNKIFIAIDYRKDLFEPAVFSSLLDFETAKEYVENLQLAVSVVEDLNLNRRIWSKK
ncbi:DUF3137 domain-containing protein [Nitrosophilus alvini]|uniref:DUF3137 domain-containing protein n=1 Tax=Nitrosophilus alvini TaxID=2714855 RepID=UPI00190B2B34|nr:DUF3137 domain-containing protein [Nitrosophilus alvini]